MNWFKNTRRTPWLTMSQNVMTVVGDDGVDVSAGFLPAIGLDALAKTPFKIEAREVETKAVEAHLAPLPPNQFVLGDLKGGTLARLNFVTSGGDRIDREEGPGLILNGGQLRFLTALLRSWDCDVAFRLVMYDGSVGQMLSLKLARVVQHLPFSFSRRVRRIWESEDPDVGSASSVPASGSQNAFLDMVRGTRAVVERPVSAGTTMSSSYDGTLVPMQNGGSVVGFAIQDPVLRSVSPVNPNTTWSTTTLTFSANPVPVDENSETAGEDIPPLDLPRDYRPDGGGEEGQNQPAHEAAAEQAKPPADSISDMVEKVSRKSLASDEDIDELSGGAGSAPYA